MMHGVMGWRTPVVSASIGVMHVMHLTTQNFQWYQSLLHVHDTALGV